jgi:tetratricopeptide (TPR) repeat protein
VAKVFISYSHDSDEHRDRVLSLSEQLRRDGVETMLDRYVAGSPLQGWPRWMLDQLDAADRVLIVCSEVYYQRFRGHARGEAGAGADWEGAIITQEIYASRSQTLKFAPVFLAAPVKEWIPEPLRGWTYYALTSEEGYGRLYDFLTDQAGVTPGPVGEIKVKPRREVPPLTFASKSNTPVQSLRQLLRPNESGTPVQPLLRTKDSVTSVQPPRELLGTKESARDPNYDRGLRLLAEGKLDGAIDAFSRTIDGDLTFHGDPNVAPAHYDRGFAHYLRSTRRQPPDVLELYLAIDDLDRALRLGFRDAKLFLVRAELYELTFRSKDAIADYEAALSLATEDDVRDQARERLRILHDPLGPLNPPRRR